MILLYAQAQVWLGEWECLSHGDAFQKSIFLLTE